MTGHRIIATMPLNGDIITPEAAAGIVGQRVSVLRDFNWADPLGKATILAAEAVEDGRAIKVTMEVSERTMRELGHVDDRAPYPVLRSVESGEYSLGFRLNAADQPENGPRTFKAIDALEVCRTHRRPPASPKASAP